MAKFSNNLIKKISLLFLGLSAILKVLDYGLKLKRELVSNDWFWW